MSKPTIDRKTTQQKGAVAVVDAPTDESTDKIELLELKLENFKGVKNFELRSGGGNISVYGNNAAGKTTLADGFSWLLFNKNSHGRADFDIKTITPSGETLRGLDHSVEAVLSIDGERLELRKVFKEKWTRKRGAADKEFTGNTKQHFLDGVPVNQSDYEAQIASIAKSEELFQLLTNPVHFAERLHWQERRQMLLEICGDISDDDVIASSRDLDDLPDILDGKSLDDYRKIAAARKRKINGELQLVPARIDEVSRSLPELQAVDLDELGKQILKLRGERNAAEEARTRIKSGGEIAERTKQLREIEATIIEERNSRFYAQANAEADERQKLSKAKDELETAVRQNGQLENYIKNAEADIQTFEKRMDELRNRWREIDKEAFESKQGDDACAACGQQLPPEQIDEARAKAQAAFNGDKAMRLGSIDSDGKELREKCDNLKEDIEKQREKLAKGEALVAESQGRVEALQAKSKQEAVLINDSPTQFEQELTKQKREFEVEIENLKKGSADALAEVEKEIAGLDDRIEEHGAALMQIELRRKDERRIDELKSQERLLASEYEELERGLYLCDLFLRKKVSTLTEKINSKFENVSFKLFDVQVNGAIQECCQVTHEGVPWASMNTGAQMNAGLEIIDILGGHYGIFPCIWIDHAESTTRLRPTKAQQIRLIVSPEYPQLHVEASS